jgi:hypothetical protein
MAIEAPNRKVNVGLAAGAIMTILAWISKAFGGPEITAEVALSGSTLIVFVLQYLVPEPPDPDVLPPPKEIP